MSIVLKRDFANTFSGHSWDAGLIFRQRCYLTHEKRINIQITYVVVGIGVKCRKRSYTGSLSSYVRSLTHLTVLGIIKCLYVLKKSESNLVSGITLLIYTLPQNVHLSFTSWGFPHEGDLNFRCSNSQIVLRRNWELPSTIISHFISQNYLRL